MTDYEIERDKMIFTFEMENKLAGLELQKKRIHQGPLRPTGGMMPPVNHDADFYMVLLRRLYRMIENAAKTDSRVANLKGKYKDLNKKIRLRDHFEHGYDINNLTVDKPGELPGFVVPKSSKVRIQMATCVFINNTDSFITSGNTKWYLESDHQKFLQLISKYVKLYPFNIVIEKNETIWTRLIKKLINYLKKTIE